MAPNTAHAATGINHQINFQGKLVNPSGTNVTDGSYSVVFSLYNVASAGAAIWTETQSVTVSAGVFQLNLGSVTALPGSIDFNTDNIYLGIKVGADAEMTPRVQFTSVPQAFNAEKLGGLDKTGFIQNTTVQQATSNFNISGAGVVGTNLTAGTSVITPLLQSAAATALTITGNAASTWSTSAGNITLQAGSGTISLGSTTTLSSSGALTITGGTTLALTSTGISAISLDSGTTGAVNIGTNANAKTITIGNITLATALNQRVGTGNYTLDGVTSSTYTFGASTTTGTITIGGTAQTGTLTVGSSSGTNIVNIAGGAGATTLNLANVQVGGAINLGAGMTTGTITIGGTGLQTGTIGLGIGTGAQIINLGTGGTGAKTVTVGSTASTGLTTIQSGSGGIALSGNTTITGTLQGSTATLTGANSLTLGTSSSATGSIIVNNATNAFTSTIQGNTGATASYTSILPGAVGVAGQCLALASVVTTTQTLGYATCGGAGGANAQLSNLSGTVAVNLSLLSAANNTLNLGSAANVWQNTYTGVVDAGSVTTTLGVGSVNATTVTVGNTANTTTASIIANTTLNLGNNANNKTVNIGATGATANTTAVNIASTTSTGGASTVQIGGTGVTSGSNAGSTVTAQGGQTSLSVATAGATLKTFTDSATAFRVQSSASNNVIGVDTSGGIVTVGQALGLTGKLTFANATNGFTSTITGNTGATASYTSILPGAVGTAGQCLAVASVATTTQTLGYAACGGGGGGTLQAAYTASTDPEFALGTAATAGISIRDNATPISGNLLELQNSTGTINYFGATSTGLVLQRAAATTALSFSFSTGELRVYDIGVSGNYAVMSYASNTATFAASAGITQIGSGAGSGGNINLMLTGTADQLLTTKTNTLAAAYSVNDFKFTRNLTASTFAVTGNVMTIEDITAFTSGSSAPNVLYVNQNNSSATGNLILAQTGGGANDRFKVTTAGDTTVAGSITSGTSVAVGTSLTVGSGVSIGAGQSYTGAGAITLQSAATTALTVDSGTTGTLSIGTSANAKTIVIGNATGASSLTMQAGTGGLLLKPITANTAAFTLQDSASQKFLILDSTNDRLQVGDTTADTTGVLLVLDTKNDAVDPTGVNGAMYYNSNAGRFRCYENSAWADCLGYRHLITFSADTTSTASLTCMNVAGGATFPVTSGVTYHFQATILRTATAATIGAAYSVNAPASPTIYAISNVTGAAATVGSATLNTCTPATTASATTTGNIDIVTGIITPSASGTFQLRYAPETATAGQVIKAGSTLEWW